MNNSDNFQFACYRSVLPINRHRCHWLDAVQPPATQRQQDGVMWCTTDRRQHLLPTVGPTIGSFSATPASTVRDLGIYIDLDLSMRSHVRWTVSRCFATLPQLCTIRRQVPTTVFQSLATALVLPHLDYCNSVLYGLPTSLIQRLQSVQHSEHISPALISLHWLRIPERSPSNWQF